MNVLPDGENRYRLTTDAGRELGWIHGRAARFLGFASPEHVMGMAQRAWHALQTVLRNEGPAPRTLRLDRDGGYELMSDGAIPVARLRPPKRSGRESSFAIELVVPANATDGLALTAARAIAAAVEPVRDRQSPDDAFMAHFIP